MASQATLQADTSQIIKAGGLQRGGFTIAQYATGVIPAGTVLGQVTASDKLLPITDVAATDGTKFPKFITQEAIDATAGDVTGVTVYIMGRVNESKINLENSLTLEDYITLGTNFAVTIRQALRMNGLNVEASAYIDEYENVQGGVR